MPRPQKRKTVLGLLGGSFDAVSPLQGARSVSKPQGLNFQSRNILHPPTASLKSETRSFSKKLSHHSVFYYNNMASILYCTIVYYGIPCNILQVVPRSQLESRGTSPVSCCGVLFTHVSEQINADYDHAEGASREEDDHQEEEK